MPLINIFYFLKLYICVLLLSLCIKETNLQNGVRVFWDIAENQVNIF